MACVALWPLPSVSPNFAPRLTPLGTRLSGGPGTSARHTPSQASRISTGRGVRIPKNPIEIAFSQISARGVEIRDHKSECDLYDFARVIS
eukprot:1057815-Prymnesium_polylepis.1